MAFAEKLKFSYKEEVPDTVNFLKILLKNAEKELEVLNEILQAENNTIIFTSSIYFLEMNKLINSIESLKTFIYDTKSEIKRLS